MIAHIRELKKDNLYILQHELSEGWKYVIKVIEDYADLSGNYVEIQTKRILKKGAVTEDFQDKIWAIGDLNGLECEFYGDENSHPEYFI